MTQISYLHFHHPESGSPPELIAGSEDSLAHMPSMWRLMLAGAEPGPALPLDLPEGEAEESLMVSAADAVERLQVLAAFIKGHPLLHRIPELPVYLDGAVAFLRLRLQAWPAHERGQVMLVAQACERDLPEPWQLDQFETEWGDLQLMVKEDFYHWVDQLLGFDSQGHSFGQWRSWPKLFGLETLAHPFFARLDYDRDADFYLPPPAPMAFEKFREPNGESPAGAWRGLKHALAGLLGTRAALEPDSEPAPAQQIVPPEPIRDPAAGGYDHWRDWGIRRTALGDKFGLMSEESRTWVAPPDYDEIIWSELGWYCVWRVRQGALWGLLDATGELLQPCIFDAIDSYGSDRFQLDDQGWQVLRDGRWGWVTAQGKWNVACDWDEIKPLLATGVYSVRQGALWGLVASDNVLLTPCAYLSAEPLALGRHIEQDKDVGSTPTEHFWPHHPDVAETVAAADGAHANLLIAVRSESGMGVVDQAHRLLVPLIYADVVPPQCGSYRDPLWMLVTAEDGRRGVWSMDLGAEVIACEHEWIDMFVSPVFAQPLIGLPDGARYRLTYIDGRAAFPESFRWVGTTPFYREWPMPEGVSGYDRASFAQAWSSGKPICATVGDDDQVRVVYLIPGQPIAAENESLAQAWQGRGDLRAAFMLAEKYAEGEHLPQDLALARLWAGRACGHEPAPVLAVPDEDDDDDRLRSERAERAARLFATMLNEATGGARDAPLARHWAQIAMGCRPECGRSTRLLMAKLLLDDSAGAADPARAYAELELIKAPSRSEGEACLVRANCMIEGVGTARNLEGARELLVRADAGGQGEAAPALARLLESMASKAPRRERQLLLLEAAYYEEKHAQELLDAS